MARDALALADALELGSFHLLGYSMGGAIAQEIACQAPERLRTLTLSVTFAAGGAWARTLSDAWSARVQPRVSREPSTSCCCSRTARSFPRTPTRSATCAG